MWWFWGVTAGTEPAETRTLWDLLRTKQTMEELKPGCRRGAPRHQKSNEEFKLRVEALEERVKQGGVTLGCRPGTGVAGQRSG